MRLATQALRGGTPPGSAQAAAARGGRGRWTAFLFCAGVHCTTERRVRYLYLDRILSGANPATLPIEFATRDDLVVSASTAEAFGLSIPQALLVSAEVVR